LYPYEGIYDYKPMKVGQVDLKKEFYRQMVDVQLTDFVQSKNLKKDLET